MVSWGKKGTKNGSQQKYKQMLRAEMKLVKTFAEQEKCEMKSHKRHERHVSWHVTVAAPCKMDCNVLQKLKGGIHCSEKVFNVLRLASQVTTLP